MNPPETSEDRDNIGDSIGDRNFVNDDNSDNTRNNMEDVSDDRMNSDQSQGQFPFQNNNNQNLPIKSVVSKDTIKNVNPFNPNDNSNDIFLNSSAIAPVNCSETILIACVILLPDLKQLFIIIIA